MGGQMQAEKGSGLGIDMYFMYNGHTANLDWRTKHPFLFEKPEMLASPTPLSTCVVHTFIHHV